MNERIDHAAAAKARLTIAEGIMEGRQVTAKESAQIHLEIGHAHAMLAVAEQLRVQNQISLVSANANQIALGISSRADFMRIYDIVNPEIVAALFPDEAEAAE